MLPYARGSRGAPLVRAKIIEALESVGKLRQGTCVVYNNGLYDGGLFRIKPSGWGQCICSVCSCFVCKRVLGLAPLLVAILTVAFLPSCLCRSVLLAGRGEIRGRVARRCAKWPGQLCVVSG